MANKRVRAVVDMSGDFQSAWERFHPGSLPLSHLVRETEHHNWLRFHSLPESKRYAESEDEMAIILDRQNSIAATLFGNDTSCWMIGCFYAPPLGASYNESYDSWRENQIKTHSLSHAFSVTVPEDEDEEKYDIFVAKVIWETRKQDRLLREIANDQQHLFWMSDTDGTIFAPYDGGLDLILPKISNIVNLSLQFSDWLSSYRGGY